MEASSRKILLGVLIGGILVTCGTLFIPQVFKTSYVGQVIDLEEPVVAAAVDKVTHVDTPSPLKSLYMTSCVASTPSWRESLANLIDTTELNSIVLDIKDSTGVISFKDESLQTDKIAGFSGCKVSDMREFIQDLHEKNIYVIGRLSVFQDPYYSITHPELAVKSKSTGGVWKDRKGLSFIDVGAKPYWDYVVDISLKSYEIGFDEINFDYVRYPSDGNMKDTNFSWTVASSTKPEMLENFFIYLDKELDGSGVVTSADIFGMTTTVYSDMGIGQVLERTLPHFDYVAPMVYPSHYPKGWNGFANPASNPYEVVKIAMTSAREREVVQNVANGLATSTPSKLRTWVQDFSLGAVYTPDMVKAQFQATYDSGLDSWMLWNASNKYTAGALLIQ